MTDAKPTPGPWAVRDPKVPGVSRHIWVEGGPPIGETIAGPYRREILEDEDYLEKRADADLIADAGNVYAETGCTPSQLLAWVKDLQSGLYVNCVYCGHRYGPGETTPVSMADALKAHIEACPSHPMSKLKADYEARQRAQTGLLDVILATDEIVFKQAALLRRCKNHLAESDPAERDPASLKGKTTDEVVEEMMERIDAACKADDALFAELCVALGEPVPAPRRDKPKGRLDG